MATLAERKDYCTRGIELRDFRNDKGDGYEDTPHRKTKAKKPVKHVGCPGNDGGQHVYVWTRETYWKPVWRFNNWFYYFSDYEYRTCAGCYKHKGMRRRKDVR